MHTLKPRPGILEIAPYIGGRSRAEGCADPIRLASNESSLGPSPAAVEAYQNLIPTLHRYPDSGSSALAEAIAAIEGLEPDRIVCGNGSDEILGLLARAYAGEGDEVLYSAHGFIMYPIAARTAGAVPVAAPEQDLVADVDALLGRVTDRTKVLFLANPNNPTGTYLNESELRRLHKGLPGHVLLVIDAAYAEYVTRNDYEAGAALVRDHENVVMTRTFSKIHGLAALRVGWAYAGTQVVDVLHRVRGPFNVNAAAQVTAAAAIRDREHIARVRSHNESALSWFRERVLELGLVAPPSVGNFLLVRFPDAEGPKGAQAANTFLTQRGILVRPMAAAGLPDSLRIGIGLDDEMTQVVTALEEFQRQS